MTAERRFRRTVLLTALAGHLTYSISAEKPLLALFGIACFILSRWLTSRQLSGRPTPIPRGLLNGMVIVAILHLVFQLVTRGQEVITSLTDFLCYVMLVKSLDRARMRDEAQLLGLSLFVVIGALLTGQSLLMGLALTAYTPLAIISAVSLQLFAARERQRDLYTAARLPDLAAGVDANLTRVRGGRSVAAVAVLCAIASMAAGVVAFLITPRQLAQQLGMAAATYGRSGTTTGYTESIKLGQQGNITEDDTPVMDVRITSSGPAQVGPIYLRGSTLVTYDASKGTWAPTVDPAKSGLRGPFDLQQTGQLRVPAAEEPRAATTLEVIIRNARSDQDAPLFAPYHPITVQTELGKPIRFQAADALLRTEVPNGRMVYTVTSAPDFVPSRTLPSGRPAPPDETPPEQAPISPRIKALTQSLLTDRDIDATAFATEPSQVRRAVLAVNTHLSTFEYTLEMGGTPEGADPLEVFLFERKAGHCEYFASAAAVMLQSVGIPARVAAGYAAAEFNGVTGYYTVRKSDAHAWLEVQMSPNRWETFDPTPPGNLQSTRRASSGPLSWMKQLWEAVEFSWLDNVVAYDRGIKLDGLGIGGINDAGAAAVRWQNRLRSIQDWFRRHLPEGVVTRSLIVGLATFGLVLAVYGLMRLAARIFPSLRSLFERLLPGSAARAVGLPPAPPDAGFYIEALALLQDGGLGKPSATTPLDYADDLPAGLSGPFTTLSGLYYKARFGDLRLSADERANGQTALQSLRAGLKSQRPRT